MSAVELTGSRKALLELFAMPHGLPHGVRFGLVGQARKDARQQRLHNWSFAMRRGLLGFATDDDGNVIENHRTRVLRKQAARKVQP
jgi:exonuclease V gamma subunit